MKKLIAVCGSEADDPNLSAATLNVAERVGRLIAEKGAILVCGGGGGIMEAACRGAKSANGLTVGILPGDKRYANPYVDIGITTHLGRARNYILVQSADVVIGIAGRWGTLNEISFACNIGKPVVIIKGSGGWMDILSCEKVKEKLKDLSTYPLVTSSPEEAINIAFRLIHEAER